MAERILVVDDDEEIRASLRRGLSLEGFKVALAPDGETKSFCLAGAAAQQREKDAAGGFALTLQIP